MEAAALWARGDLTDGEADASEKADLGEALDFFGLVPEGPVGASVPAFYLWPENVEAWSLFLSCGTQWRSGPNGREGMSYPGVQIVMRDVVCIPRARRSQRMREVHLMSVSALNAWAELRQQREGG